jgi:cytochrome bd-type quinol oxidase subunit 2
MLAVSALVGAAALAAKSMGGTRSRGMLLATVGAVLLGIVMIIVTFSAGDPAELDVPPAAGSIVPFVAPIIPLGLAIAAFQRACSVWRSRFHDERMEAKRFAVLASLCLFVLVELGPFGAVRSAARTPSAPAKSTTTTRPAS